MSATLNVNSNVVAFGDNPGSTNPRQRFVDWTRRNDGIVVENPRSERFVVAPGTTSLVFSGERTLSLDGTTEMKVTLSPVEPSRYRMTHLGGTAPGFRTGRSLSLAGLVLEVRVQANASALFVLQTGSWAGCVAGDEVFVPHVTTGDAAGNLSVLNAGFWRVLGVNGGTLHVARLSGERFEAAAETVTLTSNSEIQVYSSAGVQPGDKLDVAGGFSASFRRTFTITSVTAKHVEFSSTMPLPEETATGPSMKVYSAGKRYVRIEADQECAVLLNGSTDRNVRLSPLEAGDPDKSSWFEKFGPTWALSIVNLSTERLSVNVITAE